MRPADAAGHEQFAYQPALDGLRGVAVLLVLLFHGGFAWMSGGYVGVSVFFTLSGFLITSLLILEHQRSGRVAWLAFVARRAKRLLPAGLSCLVLIALLSWSGEFAAVPHLRRDVAMAAGQVANWNSLVGSGSYADLLTRSAGIVSPVEHYWSLAVEEQFYWLWPLAFLLLAKVSKRPSRLFIHLAALAAAGVVGARLIALRWGADAAYWATPARLGEILVGCALGAGCLLFRRRPAWLGIVGLGGLAVVLWAAIEWPTRGGPAYAGWLGVFSLASGALILGLQVPGPLRSLFSFGPLVWLGRISYGVYVFHWPVFVLATSRSVHLHGWPLFLVRMAITLAIALASYFFLEQPVRRSRVVVRRVASLVLPVTAAVVALTLLVVPLEPSLGRATTSGAAPTTSGAPSEPGTAATDGALPAGSTSTTLPPPPDVPISVLMIGDSTALSLNDSLATWGADGIARQVRSVASVGCGLIRRTVMAGDDSGVFAAGCEKVHERNLPEALASADPGVVLILVTMPDAGKREWDSGEGMLRPTDDRYRERMLADYRSMAQRLVAAGVPHVAWVVPAQPAEWWLGWLNDPPPSPGVQQIGSVIEQVAAEFPDLVEVVRLDEWLVDQGLDADGTIREDGLHFTPAGGRRVMDELLGPVLLRLAAL